MRHLLLRRENVPQGVTYGNSDAFAVRISLSVDDLYFPRSALTASDRQKHGKRNDDDSRNGDDQDHPPFHFIHLPLPAKSGEKVLIYKVKPDQNADP